MKHLLVKNWVRIIWFYKTNVFDFSIFIHENSNQLFVSVFNAMFVVEPIAINSILESYNIWCFVERPHRDVDQFRSPKFRRVKPEIAMAGNYLIKMSFINELILVGGSPEIAIVQCVESVIRYAVGGYRKISISAKQVHFNDTIFNPHVKCVIDGAWFGRYLSLSFEPAWTR